MKDDLIETFKDQKVLVTGHTGFKGSWLAMALNSLGAKVYGYSIDVPTSPSIFSSIEESVYVETFWGDIADRDELSRALEKIKPSFVFHLAAQPLVSVSYENPWYTASTNALGSVALADAIRTSRLNLTAIFITSDKCYENVEQPWGYREVDRLGGADVYSASKAAAELLLSAFHRSFFQSGDIRLATARAGNVIGGGDWSANRIVPDIVKSFISGSAVEIRNPQSTRPWQHVLEPVFGYLQLAMHLRRGNIPRGESYNFGPSSSPRTVAQLVEEIGKHFQRLKVESTPSGTTFHEAGLLALSWEKANSHFGWRPLLNFEETVELTAKWYEEFYAGGSALELSAQQIDSYLSKLVVGSR